MIKTNDFFVVDGHIDTATALLKQKRTFSERSNEGHCDYPRMKEGNVKTALFALYPMRRKINFKKGLDLWFQLVSNPNNHLEQVKSIGDFEKIKTSDKIGAILHFEGAGAIDKELKLLRNAYDLGLRSMSLTWSNTNKFGNGSRFQGKQPKEGLTPLGRKLVVEAQTLGITIDVSHSNDPTFWDIYEIAEKPIIATHSNARSINAHVRNLTDDQIKAIHEKKGLIGMNFSMGFLNPGKPGEKDLNMGFEVIKTHFDHIINLSDINTVAIGSDFDGTDVPNCVKDPTTFPALWEFLLNNGYSEKDIEKISHDNFLRIFKDTWN